MVAQRIAAAPPCLLVLAFARTAAALVAVDARVPDITQDDARALALDSQFTDPWQWLYNRTHGRFKQGQDTRANSSTPAVVAKVDAKVHTVQHIALLNKTGFWWLMSVVIICIAVAVVRMELRLKDDMDEAARLPRAGPPSREGPAAALADDRGVRPAEDPLRWVAHLLFCVVGLNVSMLFWGVAQEFMMTSVYVTQEGKEERIPSALCLVFFNRLLSVAVTASIIKLSPRYSFDFGGRLACGLPAASNLLASWCQYQSLAYVSFPIQTAAKSAKLLPVVVLGTLRGKRQTVLDYAESILIVFALVVFGIETDGDSGEVYAQGFGVLLLCGLIFFDSITPHLQDGLFKRNPELSMVQATFAMACFSSAMSAFTLLVSGYAFMSARFFWRHPDAILHALVLSLCSTLTQFMISYTIKHFGPVTFALISTTRQLISVCLSAVMFKHHITLLAWISAAVVFGTVIGRAVRPREVDAGDAAEGVHRLPSSREAGPLSLVETLALRSSNYKLLVCIMGMHLPLMFYSIAQEFMFTHTFKGEIFRHSMFLIVANRAGASILAICVLKVQGLRVFDRNMWLTVLPAAANLGATYCQYEALLFLRYPVQTLLKSGKVVPVMLCGRLLKNRTYSWLDYAEGVLITGLVGVFVWNVKGAGMQSQPGAGVLPGLLLMGGYLLMDSVTSNAEDVIYQRVQLDPGQMLLGMQASSGVVGLSMLLISGQINSAVRFLMDHPSCFMHLLTLVLAEACGAYACTVTVRLFGPAVFTLLLMSHQVSGLVVSVALFGHSFDMLSCCCLGVVTLVILTSSLRRVRAERLLASFTEKPAALSK